MDSNSRQRFGLVPAQYLDHPDLCALELAVLFVLCAHADRLGLCWPSQSTIAAKSKLDRSTVNRILAKLVRLGLIEKGRHPNPKIRTCTYRLVGHEALLESFSSSAEETAENPMPLAANVAPHFTSEVELAEAAVADGDTEHLEQNKLSLERASASKEDEVSRDQWTGREDVPTLGDDWTPSPVDISFAQAHRADLTLQDIALIRQKFVLYYLGKQVVDPSNLFRRWLLTERKSHVRIDDRTNHRIVSRQGALHRVRHRNDAAAVCSGQTRFDAWAHAAVERRARYAHHG